jgi:hypothetical protein
MENPEEWKKVNVPFYSDYYEISTHGHIRSLAREGSESSPGRKGKIKRQNGKDMKGYKNKKGYYNAELCVEGKRKSFPVHRLVGLTFLENPFNKPMIDHIDRNPSNNHLSNLRWATGCENQANRGIPKNNTSGELHINVLYKFMVVRQGKRIQKGFSTMEEAVAYRKEILGF